MPTVVIAAGGTAGHVVPALAVADELRDRGARVSLGGHAWACRGRARAARRIRDRVLLGHAASIAAIRCERARRCCVQPGRCRRRGRFLRRIGADAVLAGGGYVAGPVGLAAALTRTPLVLTEADSRLGLANRLLAPLRAQRVPRVPARGPRRRQVPRHGAAGAPRGRHHRPRRRTRAAGDRRRRAMPARVRREPRRPNAQPRRGGGVRRAARAPGSCTSPAAATSPTSSRRCERWGSPARYRLFEYLDTLADPLAASDLVLARAGGSIVEITAAGTAGGAGAVSARDRRPPGLERPLDGGRGRGGRDARRRARQPHDWPQVVGDLLADERTPRAHDRGGASAGAARRRRAGRRSGARHRRRSGWAVGGPAASLRRDRRGRHERPGARRRAPRRRGERLRPGRVRPTCASSARRGSSRSSATTRRTPSRASSWSPRRRSRTTSPSWRRPARSARRSRDEVRCSPRSRRCAA